jgi:hypothetical protein
MSPNPDRPTTTAPAGVDDDARPGAGEAPGASLDQVRDILFGQQSRDYDRRFSRLEERLVKETADLREDMRKRVEVLEQFVRRETESLVERITRERDERVSGAQDLSRALKDATQAQDKRAADFDEQLARAQRDTRQQLLDQQNRLTDEIRQKADDLLTTIAREAGDLRTEKVDRGALAALLSEVALRLNNQLTLPGDDTPRD